MGLITNVVAAPCTKGTPLTNPNDDTTLMLGSKVAVEQRQGRMLANKQTLEVLINVDTAGQCSEVEGSLLVTGTPSPENGNSPSLEIMGAQKDKPTFYAAVASFITCQSNAASKPVADKMLAHRNALKASRGTAFEGSAHVLECGSACPKNVANGEARPEASTKTSGGRTTRTFGTPRCPAWSSTASRPSGGRGTQAAPHAGRHPRHGKHGFPHDEPDGGRGHRRRRRRAFGRRQPRPVPKTQTIRPTGRVAKTAPTARGWTPPSLTTLSRVRLRGVMSFGCCRWLYM